MTNQHCGRLPSYPGSNSSGLIFSMTRLASTLHTPHRSPRSPERRRVINLPTMGLTRFTHRLSSCLDILLLSDQGSINFSYFDVKFLPEPGPPDMCRVYTLRPNPVFHEGRAVIRSEDAYTPIGRITNPGPCKKIRVPAAMSPSRDQECQCDNPENVPVGSFNSFQMALCTQLTCRTVV